MLLGMKKQKAIIKNFITAFAVAALTLTCHPLTAEASTISGIQNNIDSITQQLQDINNEIAAMEDEQDLIQEAIDDLNAEILNTMTSISMLEDEIAQKRAEIADKQTQIEATEAEYEAALQKEEDQRASMAAQTRLMYENGNDSYLNALLKGKGIGDVLNSMDYIEKVYEYNKRMLNEFIETKELVQELWNQLEAEKAALEQDMQNLQADEAALREQKAGLDVLLEQKKRESANYAAEISRLQQEAAVSKTQLQQEQKRLKELQAALAAQNKKPTTNPVSSTTNYTAVINAASGSDLGKQIANYACQYIGNPYVAGGTSLTQGADCSGFTYRVYADYGYSLPRTSSQQRSAGTGVSYEEAQPGDLICYEGHVAIYIGNNLIVHASSSRTGIKISNAQYKTILAVRRII
ncbi:MAG: NlpC/P60 family protein [Eubacterium sp.]|nr:NlpC/P60 family protein [Eubacterium sp.]MCM1218905.1 NlpC/P60 family protein [Lachnospiraceae bacterium]MCM1240500.1 NlpC/P60 family protein [Lachnospiraceae bacterium]